MAVGLMPRLVTNVSSARGVGLKLLLGEETKGLYLWMIPFILVPCVMAVLFVRFKNKLPNWLSRHGMAIGYAIFLAFYSAIIILNTWKFEHQVELVRMMNRQDLPPQNDWDFGQTTALMIWFPVAWELLTLIRKSLSFSETRRC